VLRPVRDDRGDFGGITSGRDLVRVAALFARLLLSLRAGLRGGLGLQGGLRRPDRGQPALPAGQLNRQLITAAVRTVRDVLRRIQPLRLDLPGQLGLGPHHRVVAHRPVPARRRRYLRPIQGDPTQRHQTSLGTQRQRLSEQSLQRRPYLARNRLIATKSGAACAIRNRNAMSSWQRHSNAREDVTPWE